MDSDLKRIHSAHVLVSYPNLRDATSSNSWRRIGECAVTDRHTHYTLINNIYDITGIMFTAFENGKVVLLGEKSLFFHFIKDTKMEKIRPTTSGCFDQGVNPLVSYSLRTNV